MLSLVTAAEQQYRHETELRDRELALLRSIRDRRESQAAALAAPAIAPKPVAPARPRGVWARPIAVHSAVDDCPAACAIA